MMSLSYEGAGVALHQPVIVDLLVIFLNSLISP